MTDELRGGSRHLGIEGVKSYLEEGVPGTLQLEGDPIAYLLIDPAGRRLAIQVPANGPVPNCARYENVAATRVRRGDEDWNEFSVAAGDRLEDLYPLLCQVLDRVQLEGQSFGAAVLDVLHLYRSVLSTRAGMSESVQVGLYGELLTLEHLINTTGVEAAIGRWLGPSDEEHDFAFTDFDLEVKTTTSERRRHWISSPTQLTPTKPKRLFLLSTQITGAGEHGRTLPMLVDEIAGRVGHQAEVFLAELETVGYRTHDADLYPKAWTLRTRPASFCVDENFPAIDTDALTQSVPEISRIVELQYLVDLTGLPQSSPEILQSFTKPEETE